MARFTVGIAGATGLVGQRLVERLAAHPWFELAAVGASERSVGRPFGEAATWKLAGDLPAAAAALPVGSCEPETFKGCRVVLSALDSPIAREVEPRIVRAGIPVVSNSSAFRMDPEVPLLVPEINAAHAEVVRERAQSGDGFLVTNPNCSATGLAIVLAPLHRAFGVRRVFVATLQVLSGAGAEGPRALDLIDNVIPHIGGEEEKIESERQAGDMSCQGGGNAPGPELRGGGFQMRPAPVDRFPDRRQRLVSGRGGDPGLPRLRRAQARPAARHRVRRPGRLRAVRRGEEPLAHRDCRRQAVFRALAGRRGGLPVRRERASDSGAFRLPRPLVPHRRLAARGRGLRGKTSRSDRHRLDRHPGRARDRGERGASDGVPAHRELQRAGPQRVADAGVQALGERELRRAARDRGREPAP